MAARNRFRPLVARRAMRLVRENPDDTAAAIVVIAALSGNAGKRLFNRFRRSPNADRILREKRDLYDLLADVDGLLAMPEGSLGRTIGQWFVRENIGAQGLAQASQAANLKLKLPPAAGEEQVFSTRLLNLHDVFHVVSGYDRDLRGEIAVLALTFAQTRNPGIGYLLFDALRSEGWNSETGRLIRQGYQRGRKATWLVDLDWEALLPRPIDEVRSELRLGPPPVYEQLRSAGAPVLAA